MHDKIMIWAVVVAQLVERLLLTPEVRDSNPVIGKLLYWTFICLLSIVLRRRKMRKEAGNGPFKKEYYSMCFINFHLEKLQLTIGQKNLPLPIGPKWPVSSA